MDIKFATSLLYYVGKCITGPAQATIHQQGRCKYIAQIS